MFIVVCPCIDSLFKSALQGKYTLLCYLVQKLAFIRKLYPSNFQLNISIIRIFTELCRGQKFAIPHCLSWCHLYSGFWDFWHNLYFEIVNEKKIIFHVTNNASRVIPGFFYSSIIISMLGNFSQPYSQSCASVWDYVRSSLFTIIKM